MVNKYLIIISGGVEERVLGPFKENAHLFLKFCKDIGSGGSYDDATDNILYVSIENNKIKESSMYNPSWNDINPALKDIDKIKGTKHKNLPLLIGSIKSEVGNLYLEEKLKGKL